MHKICKHSYKNLKGISLFTLKIRNLLENVVKAEFKDNHWETIDYRCETIIEK